ncbi:flagellar hook-length control protein FliK [Alphaproteobacteria bacterium]|nr:flagellar hook-length control protein FliK [Alphaproteobacteria bacterium]
MSEILSKSMHMSGAGTASSVAAKTETNGDDLLFAALFGGATGDISGDDDKADAAVLAGVFAVQASEQDDPESPPQEALLAMIAAMQAAKGLDQKQAGKAKDAASENSDATGLDEDHDALADMIATVPLGPHIDPVNADAVNADAVNADAVNADAVNADAVNADAVNADAVNGDAVNADAVNADAVNADAVNADAVNADAVNADAVNGDLAKGAIAEPLQNTKSIRTNMAFEDGNLSSQTTANLPKIGLGPMQGLRQGPMPQTVPVTPPNSIVKAVGELATTGQAAPSETFVGPMPALSAEAKMAANIANLRAIRAANLEQRNAEINAKLSGDDAADFIGKSDKAITTAASLQQALMTDSPMLMGDKMLTRATAGLDMARPNQASSILAESASGANGQSLNNQTGGQAGGQAGGQTGGQTGGQAGGQSGGQAGATSGGLLNNLNMLQTLDMAQNNWTQMLLQRVQKGLAGGKDQLDFQLNPRNLGKMQISLVIQNDRTNIQIQTETSAAASMLSDSEARLAQMLEASGLRLGNLNSGQSHGFGGNMSGGHANQQNQAENSGKAIAGKADDDGDNSADLNSERSENLINIQA